MTAALKEYFPQVLEWFKDKDTFVFCDFVTRWPTLKQAQRALAFVGQLDVEVVVVELGVRIGIAGEGEGALDVFGPHRAQRRGIAQVVARVRHGLVHDVPACDPAAVTPGDPVDVTLELREQVADVAGQEIMTSDKVTLRVNLIVTWFVTDVVRAVNAATAKKVVTRITCRPSSRTTKFGLT